MAGPPTSWDLTRGHRSLARTARLGGIWPPSPRLRWSAVASAKAEGPALHPV